VDRIKEIYVRILGQNWQELYKRHPEQVIEAAEKNKGQLTSAFFAEAKNGTIYRQLVGILFDRNKQPPIYAITGDQGGCLPCGLENAEICIGGEQAIADEFCLRSTPRAKREADNWSPSKAIIDRFGKGAALAIRLADLTAAYDKSGTVGGQIDAVQLKSDGSIQWLAKKEYCPENQN
jgi:hypothetical protein